MPSPAGNYTKHCPTLSTCLPKISFARQIMRLIRDTELLERIRVAARREVETAYSFESMVEQIEDSLVTACQGRASA